MSTPTVHPLPTPIKGKADWRNYKAFRLDNGVTCLVVDDKESKTTAMSTVVEVGAASDPRSLSGLAHFCEHMCFLGSEKYPEENEYKRYVSMNGGRSNASTSMHVTNYKFEVIAEKAEKAIDIFSNFFVAPLFTSSGTGREVQAVDSENSKNLTADGRRRLQILKDLADPQHYYSKFSTGNAETLPTNDPQKLELVREALLAFHRKHYRPEKMTVCIAGPQSIETLEDWVVSRYSQISSKPFPAEDRTTLTIAEQLVDSAATDAPPYAFDAPAPPYNPPFKASLQGSWPVLLTTKPLQSMRKLVMMFVMPSDLKTPDRAPSSALSHLLGHEGVGSVFATLQNSGLLSALSAGSRTSAPDFKLFQVDMTLTEAGEQNWEKVVDVVFAYCRLLVREAMDDIGRQKLKRIWGETADLDRMFFNQTSPVGVCTYVPNLADRVVAYGTEACLSAGNMLHENEETCPLEKFVAFAKLLMPENCIIERCSEGAYEEVRLRKKFDTGYGLRKEKWYGVEYYLTPIASKWKEEWKGSENSENDSVKKSELRLPEPNRYIPRTLELCSDLPEEAKKGPRIEKSIDPPLLLVNEKKWKLFHRLDDRYALPQSNLNFLIRNIATQSIQSGNDWVFDARTALMSSLLAGMFNEAMSQETYDAGLAGLHWYLTIGAAGLRLNCAGFSDRLPDLGLKVLSDFLSGEFLDKRYFISSRDRVIRGLRTYFESRRADAYSRYYVDTLLATLDGGIEESLEFAVSLNYDDVVKHHQSILRHDQIAVDCLFTGNVSAGEAAQFFSEARANVERNQQSLQTKEQSETFLELIIPASSIERMLRPGQEIQLHFASKNPEEENGAVLYTYQSSLPSYKGEGFYNHESLLSSSAIRLLCHMLQEPLFDDLRTKQQLGYIVSSYHEVGYSSLSSLNGQIPITTPIDFILINVLSRKMAPPDIAGRIDDFLTTFRNVLATMPESEIEDHADALATKLLKPIQKIQTESSSHYASIHRYGPEIYWNNEDQNSEAKSDGIPWKTSEALAAAIRKLSRQDLLSTWDRMTHPTTRSRVVSCVYGSTFPLNSSDRSPSGVKTLLNSIFTGLQSKGSTTTIVNDFSSLLKLRQQLPEYGPVGTSPGISSRLSDRLQSLFQNQRRMKMIGLVVLAASMVGSALLATESTRRRKGGGGNSGKMLASSVFFLVALAIPSTSASVWSSIVFLGFCGGYYPSTALYTCFRGRSTTIEKSHPDFSPNRIFSVVHTKSCAVFSKPGFDFGMKASVYSEAVSSSGFDRRHFLGSIAAASVLIPAGDACGTDASSVSNSLDNLQFGNGHWNAMTSIMDEDCDDRFDNRNIRASRETASTVVPAYFATYLTRILINFDDGVAAWWSGLKHSYSLLPDDQQRNRLGKDFGKFAASVQRALQDYVGSQVGSNVPIPQVYESIFEMVVAPFTDSDNRAEVERHVLLLAASLPPDQQPSSWIKKVSVTSSGNTSAGAVSDSWHSEDLSILTDDLSVLLPRQFMVKDASDGSVFISPPVSLFDVGVGEEFGQAATATTFGPLAATELTRDLPQYSFDVYALFGISGATGCCLTHSLVIPLDVLKTKEQVWSTEEGYNSNMVGCANRILREEGVSGLLTGAQATLAGYFWYGLSVYPSYAFFKRCLAGGLLPVELATAHSNGIALVAGALAAVVASMGLTPLEAARIRVVADPARYRHLGLVGTLKAIASEGDEGPWKSLYAGLPSLLTRQVIFGSVKFLAFERACEFMYLTWPFLRDATWTSLSVSLIAGGFSGALSSVVSQPADAVLTYVAAMEKSTDDGSSEGTIQSSLGVLEGSRLMIEEGGFWSLFRGLGSRCVWAAAIIAGQFLLYDMFRNYFGVNSDDLSQVFRIDLQ